tara:strand:+ start:432 stop:848 length:417 start_codon:yes stop_codon:yes gene_type:complete
MPLGQHLRSHQNTGLSGCHLSQQFIKIIFAARRIAIDTKYRCVREMLLKGGLASFCADAGGRQRFALTAGAMTVDWFATITVVAAQMWRMSMQRQASIAVSALCCPAAVLALQHRRIAAPVDKNKCLITPAQMILQAA